MGSIQRFTCFLLLAARCSGVLGSDEAPTHSLHTRGIPNCGVRSSNMGNCTRNRCCSKSGFCGTDHRYCGNGCQVDFSGNSCRSLFPDTAETETIPRPHVGDVPYGRTIKSCTKMGVLALSFDDGPLVNNTDEILDLLQQEGVPATFFVSGSNKNKGRIDEEATGYPRMIRRMFANGHHIGSHTWTHTDLDQLAANSPKQLRLEMMYLEMALYKLVGVIPTYMRPPRLHCSESTGCLGFMTQWGYHVINTNLNTKDWAIKNETGVANSKEIIAQALSKDPTKHGYIVEAHDTMGEHTLELARFAIKQARENGYQLVTIGECLEDPEENWYRRNTTEGASPLRLPTEYYR